MAQVNFMNEIVNEYRKQFKDDTTAPILTGYVSNDMTSNYYFIPAGTEYVPHAERPYYVDQFTLQEYFDDDDADDDTTEPTGYNNATLLDKVHALQELAYVTCGGQL